MSRKSTPFALIAYALASTALPVGAQGLAGDISAVSVGMPLTAVGSPLSGVQLQAVKGNGIAVVKLSQVQSLTGYAGLAQFDTWSLIASAPLNKNGDDTTIASLDGLVNSASLEFGFTRFIAQGKRQAAHVMSKLSALDATCRRVFEARRALDGTEVPQKIDGCGSDLVNTYGSAEDKHTFESSFWDLGNSYRWLWGASAKLGYQDFEYVTSLGTGKLKSNETPWSVGLWGAVQPGDRQLLLSATAQYQHSFKEGKGVTICPIAGSSVTSVNCLAGPFEAPKPITKKLLTLEVRARPASIGFALAITRDFEAKVTGIELPIYLIADKDGKLTAGLKAGWRSDTKSGTIGLFVGAPFGLYK